VDPNPPVKKVNLFPQMSQINADVYRSDHCPIASHQFENQSFTNPICDPSVSSADNNLMSTTHCR
jgi:hypothetical protein